MYVMFPLISVTLFDSCTSGAESTRTLALILKVVVSGCVQYAQVQWLETLWHAEFFVIFVFGVQNIWWGSYSNGAGDNRPIPIMIFFFPELFVDIPDTMSTNSLLVALALQLRKTMISLMKSVRLTSRDSRIPIERFSWNFVCVIFAKRFIQIPILVLIEKKDNFHNLHLSLKHLAVIEACTWQRMYCPLIMSTGDRHG